MEMDKKIISIKATCKKYIKYFGPEPQLIKTMEECGELIQAISKYLFSLDNEELTDYKRKLIVAHLCEELSDIMILTTQIRLIINDEETFKRIYYRKLERAYNRIVEFERTGKWLA